MTDTIKFNSEDVPALEIPMDPREEKLRQNENKEEIQHIQEKFYTNTDSQEEDLRKKEQETPGNILAASNQEHIRPEPQGKTDNELGHHVLSEETEPDVKVGLNGPNERLAEQWTPTVAPNEPRNNPPYDQDQETNSRYSNMASGSEDTTHYKHDNLEKRSSNFDPTFESTIADLKAVFNSSDTSSGDKDRLSNPTPLKPIQPTELIYNLQIKAIKYIVVACFICYLLGRMRFGYTFGLLIIGLCVWTYWNIGRTSAGGLEWQLEKQENMKTLYTSEGESVEWLNYIVEKIWRSIDPEMFTIVEDLLEDTIQSVSPSVIQAVKVYDFDIGVQAPRIQMIRVFPPLPGEPEESIFGEAAFSFHAHPVASLVTNRSPKATPPGLSIRFQTALKTPLDIKAELTAVSGKIRFKILTSPDLPFISKATIAFTSVPKIETGVMPLSKHLNIMNLPTIKALVNEGVKLGFADLVDPKSMTIDIKAMLGTLALDTDAIGVVKVELREAMRDASLTLQDMEDSYATLSLNTQPKKSSSSTRVLTNDKDPRWNENLYILVSKDDVISETKVDVKVWDADKVKFDDMWGSVSISVKDIVQGTLDTLGNVASYCQDERIVFDGWTPIDGKDESQSKIKLNMKMSFHPKYPTSNMDIFSSTSTEKKKTSEEAQKKQESEDKAVLDVPVLPDHTNGIVSVTIHQAVDLEIGDPEVLPTTEEFKHPYSPSKVVSPYAILYVNDNKVFRTRTKLRNPSPHWNAITEHFVRDVDTVNLRISVKTSVDLERDPVLGTKSLSLKDLFEGQDDKFKEVQQWIPLTNGIGFGKILMTIKYKPVKMTLPRELQGADVGTLIVERLSLTNLKARFNDNSINSTKAALVLNVDPVIIKRLKAKNITNSAANEERGHDVIPAVENVGPLGWYGQHLYFPLTMRYRTAIYVHITQGSISTTKATGRFWLKGMADNEWRDITIGLHPYMSEHSKEANRNEDFWPQEGDLGQITLRMKFVSGFSPAHTHLSSFNKDFVAADPFYHDTLKYKAQKWIKEHNEKKERAEDESFDYDMQAAVQEEKNRMDEENDNYDRSSSVSSEYGEEEDDMPLDDSEIQADLIDQKKKKNVSKHQVVRKVAWGLDQVKHKVDVLKEGFNSETRAERSVAKEV